MIRISSAIAFLGTITLISSLTSSIASAFSTCASRCPSVATIVMDPGFSKSSAPLSVYFESSVLMAHIVLRLLLREHLPEFFQHYSSSQVAWESHPEVAPQFESG